MKVLFIIITVLITGAGMTFSISQLIKIRSRKDRFTKVDYFAAMAGQFTMTLVAFFMALAIIWRITL